MTNIEEQLRELAEIPALIPDRLAHRAWVVGRQQHRRRVRMLVTAVVLTAGVMLGAVAAHPALAEGESTPSVSAAQQAGGTPTVHRERATVNPTATGSLRFTLSNGS